MIGQILDRYRIESKIGQGGMGVVYQARDTHLNRVVAIKVLPPDKLADADRRQRFVREARAASALNHPNIVTVHDVRTHEGTDFIVMEYVAGRTLDQVMPPRGLAADRALHYAIQIADALARAHEAGIVHRDLKPSNVIVADDGRLKILDFGLAKLTERADRGADATHTLALTDEGTVVGTAAYMSPEQAEGRPVDARSDVFSFGAVLYEMVTGQRAFTGTSPVSVLAKVLNEDPAPPSSRAAAPPPAELERIIMRCLRKDPARRYQTMADLKIALEDLAKEAASGPLPPVAAARRRRSWWWAAAIPVAAAAIYAAAQSMRPPAQPGGPAPSVRPLTALAGIERSPAFSPDGNQVAFTWNGEKQDNQDVYVQQIGAGSALRLTTDPAIDYSPKWSPDGRAIAFLRQSPADPRRHELRLIAPLGGIERKVADLTPRPFMRQGRLAWCPDSSCVVLTDATSDDGTKPNALFAVFVDSGERRQLTFPESHALGDSDPAVSPGGGTLVFRRDIAPFSGRLFVVELPVGLNVTAAPRPVTTTLLTAYAPDWISSEEIVFSARGSLWRLKVAAGQQPQRLAVAGEDGTFPAVAPPRDGRAARLVYARSYADFNIWQIQTTAAGEPFGAPTQTIASTRRDAIGRFSPDGRRIAFMSDRLGEWEVWAADANGANAVPLTSLAANPGYPQWSPDGKTIAFHTNSESHPYGAVWLVPADGGRARALTTNPSTDVFPSFSHDGRRIYFSSSRTGTPTIFTVPVTGGDAVRVSPAGGLTQIASRDGRFLYYAESRTLETGGPLWRLSLDGGPPLKVLDRVFPAGYDVLDQGIYYLARTGSETNLVYLSFASGDSTTVANRLGAALGNLSASPDGRRVIFTRIDTSIDDLILVDNFR